MRQAWLIPTLYRQHANFLRFERRPFAPGVLVATKRISRGDYRADDVWVDGKRFHLSSLALDDEVTPFRPEA